MTRHGLLALGTTVIAISASGAAPLRAEHTDARLALTARFDRQVVQPGQIAVADVVVVNRRPESGGRAVLTLNGGGGTIVRTRSRGARCGRPDRSQRVRCVVGVHAFGAIAGVVVHVRASARAGSVRLGVSASPPRWEHVVARARIAKLPRAAPAVLSFGLETPSVAAVGRSFAARVRILNRGPSRALVGSITLTPSPSARITMPRLPRQLPVGAEPTLSARVTPLRPGRLVLDLRVGRGGSARLELRVRPAAP
jgi:hypothetical protein